MLDSRPQDFHGYRLARTAGLNLGAVHLRDRGGRDGRSETRIDLRERFIERRRHGRLRLGLRERRHLVLKAFEVVRDNWADDVRPCREKLPELDVGMAQSRQGSGERAFTAFCARSLKQPRNRDAAPGRPRQGARIDQRKDASARKHQAGTSKADEMKNSSDHNRQPEWSATTPPVIVVNETRRKPTTSIMRANGLGLGNLRIDSTKYW